MTHRAIILVSVDEGDVTIHGIFSSIKSAMMEIMNLTKMGGISMDEFTTTHGIMRSYMYLNHKDADLMYVMRDVSIPETLL